MDIDIVVMWVDGNDPEWRKEKVKYSKSKTDDSNSDNRFRDWNLMKYWFRAIEKFIPWYRRLFFVTWGHTPDFLNLNHPKIQIIRHEEFIPQEYLPTFNSCTIEMNVHRIEGLSENYILFNDDMFVLKPLKKEYFFRKNLPCTYYSEIPFGFIGPFETWKMHVVNDLRIINKYFTKSQCIKHNFGKYINHSYYLKDIIRSLLMLITVPDYFTGFKSLHCPNAYCKTTLKEIWDLEPELLHNTSSHKFRDNTAVNQWLILWWQTASGKFMPQKMNVHTFSIDLKSIGTIRSSIKKQHYDMICLNDPTDDIEFEMLSKELQSAFETILPEKCLFEK